MALIHKTCKQCQKEFQIIYESNGSGSGNAQRKKYCSDICKKNYNRNNNNGNKTEIICSVCNKIVYVAKCFSNRTTCSNVCSKLRLKNEKILKIYNVVTRKCKNLACDQTFNCNENSTQKFCSLNCGKTTRINRVLRYCLVCNKELFVKKSYEHIKFCNILCNRKGQSLGLVKSHTNGRTGWRSDIENSPYFKSSFEADYARYLYFLGINFQYEHKVFEIKIQNKTKYYTPDFYLQDYDEFIELKGIKLDNNNLFSKKINTNSEAREHLIKQGVKIKVLYMNDFYDMLKSNGLYTTIENIENKNYNATKSLITTYKDRINSNL